MLSSFFHEEDKEMFDVITDIVVDFGISSLFGNVGATLVTKSGNKIMDKVAIGIGTAMVGFVVKDVTKKYMNEKVGEVKDILKKKTDKESEKEVNEDGGEISE